MSAVAADRIRCLVPHCRCTIARAHLDPAHDEWICAKHWRAVPRGAKQARQVAMRRHRRALGRARSYLLIAEAARRAWKRCKAEAIEAAGGIAS